MKDKTEQYEDMQFWKYLCKKLKPLNDNNRTAKQIFNYLSKRHMDEAINSSVKNGMSLMRTGLILKAKVEGEDSISVDFLQYLDIDKFLEGTHYE